jgi:peptide/nickel transport system substrate-binding protein
MTRPSIFSRFSIPIRLMIVILIGFTALAPTYIPARADPPSQYPMYIPVIKFPPSWLDHIIFSAIPDPAAGISQLQAGTINVYSNPSLADVNLYNVVKSTPNLTSAKIFGLSYQLLFNTVQCTDTSLLNPFNDMKIREAMNWAVDRNYATQTILGGLGAPKFTALDTAFPDYKLYNSIIAPLEANYAYDFNKAKSIVDVEMALLGATKDVNGKWQYQGKPVTIIGLIRTEDARKPIGEYFADQLEALGFTVTRNENIRSVLAPIWQGDPYPCNFNFYTAGWINTSIVRDEGSSFATYNSGQVLNIPVMNAYQPSPTLAAAENALLINDFTSLSQRETLFQTALNLSMQESWWGVWVAEPTGFEPYQNSLVVASDQASGITGSQLWPYTLHYKKQLGGTVRIAQAGILIDPWNPINGSNWTEDASIMMPTMDRGLAQDPNTGLNLPLLVQSASVVAKTGLTVFNSSSWLNLTNQASIAVPPDAWADWNATTETFITAQQRSVLDPNYHLTANIKSTVTYLPNLWNTKWHDGSNLSLADFVMAMIMKFDPGKPASKIFDVSYSGQLQSFLNHFKGVKIVSTNPLTIETYEDAFQMDAENCLTTWYPSMPTYGYGTGAWHNLAPAIKAEEEGVMAFSADKAGQKGIYRTSMISGPTVPIQANYLNFLAAANTIPYSPTMSNYIAPAEASTRYANLKAWYQAKSNLWIGTGPYMIDQVNPAAGTISLARFADYLFPPGQFWSYIRP